MFFHANKTLRSWDGYHLKRLKIKNNSWNRKILFWKVVESQILMKFSTFFKFSAVFLNFSATTDLKISIRTQFTYIQQLILIIIVLPHTPYVRLISSWALSIYEEWRVKLSFSAPITNYNLINILGRILQDLKHI